MTGAWTLAARVALAVFYLTIAITAPDTARALAIPYALVVAGVAIYDLRTNRTRRLQ